MKKNFLNYIAVLLASSLFFSCSKKEVVDRGLTESTLDASFTISTINMNNYVAKVKDSSYILSKWDLGTGTATVGKATQPIFLPDAGSYQITHYAIGKGGATFTSSQTINVTTSDPARGNLIQGGKFETADDELKWTRLTIGAPAITWTRTGGKLVATGGSWGHSAVYQAIQVEANKDYRFGMTVSGSGASDTWFEVFFGTTVPVQNVDYSSGGVRIALNTWAGCGNTTFNGNIATIGCAGSLVGQAGKVRFTQAGTIYVLI
jgi:hypothetical protein